jgi:hypothetical protein
MQMLLGFDASSSFLSMSVGGRNSTDMRYIDVGV